MLSSPCARLAWTNYKAPAKQTLFRKHLKFCLSSTMFVGLATTQTRAKETFSACDKQKMFLKLDKQNVLVKQCLS